MQKYLETVSSVLEDAKKNDIIPFNPAHRARKRCAEKEKQHIPQKYEMQRLLQIIMNEPILYKAYYTMAIATGLRRGEACGLKWSDINWRKRTIHVQRGVVKLSHQESITKDPKTTSGDRMVYLSKEMCQLLKAWRKECEWDRKQTADETVSEDDYLFRQANGKPMNPSTFTFRFKKILKQNGLSTDLNLHSLLPHQRQFADCPRR